MAKLILQYNVGPEERVNLTGIFRASDGQESLLPETPGLCSLGELRQLSGEIQSTLADAMPVIDGKDDAPDLSGAQSHVRKLQKKGTRLQQMVLPKNVVQYLQQNPCIRQIVFRHNPLLNGVPFHAIYHDSDFLCFEYAVSKELWNAGVQSSVTDRTNQTRAAFQVFSLINPDTTLPECAKETFNTFRKDWMADTELTDLFEFSESRVSRPIKAEDALTSFHNSDVVLLNCHHVYDKESPTNSGFVLSPGQGKDPEVLTARDMMERFGSSLRPPRLILSLSCDSGITTGWEAQWPDTPTVYGMVDAFQRIGVSHYIGSICPIPAVHAPKVIDPFFRNLADGQTVGEAIRAAREELRGGAGVLSGGTALGLSLVLYGDPAKPYFCAEGHRVEVSATVECTARDQNAGVECGEVVCQEDAGYGQQRCHRHRQDDIVRCSAGHQVKSSDDLKECEADGCYNTFCGDCPGSAFGLCWFHCSHSGHPIDSEHARKTCGGTTHPGENRTVFPNDAGWMRGLCDDCFKQLATNQQMNQPPPCSHCGHWIDGNNPWKGVCRICGIRTCEKCASWHQQTLYCSDLGVANKDSRWLNVLAQQNVQNPKTLSFQKLQDYSSTAKVFKDGLASNLDAYRKSFGKIPRLNQHLHDLFMPHPRTVKLRNSLLSKDGAWLPLNQPQSAEIWNWPAGTTADNNPWHPPAAWLNRLDDLNHVEVAELRPAWGPTVLAAVVTLAPCWFEIGRGPVIVPASALHIQCVWDVLDDWWQEEHPKEPMPDTYLAALSVTGWTENLKPALRPHRAEFLFSPAANTFAERRPALAGMPSHIRKFASFLRLQTDHERLQDIEEWIEDYLDTWDYVTWDKVQLEVEKDCGFQPTANEVAAAFDELADTGKYRKCEVNKKPALRPATVAEQSRTLLRRKWVEIVSTGTGAIISFLVWQLRLFVVLRLPEHWVVALGTTVITILLCNGVGKTMKYLLTHKTS